VFEDTSSAEFDRKEAGLPDISERVIHGSLPDGTIVSGVEVFRRAYREVGLGWLLAPTAWPVIKQIADALYTVFSRNRTRISRLFGKPCDTSCEVK
jgi:predicted DCC family thiol-disulfide oxidoreductase YuxK